MRSIKDRIKDFNEIYDTYNVYEIKPLIDKCLNCNYPFCTKTVMNEEIVGCPLDIDIKKIISLIKYDLCEEAYIELTKNNPFPELTCRACEGYCELSCSQNRDSVCVNIKDMIRTLSDYALNNGLVKYNKAINDSKVINIIGSGASGLACADYLVKKGYKVNVYEKDSYPGGTLMYGISNMRLDKSILMKRIALLKEAGVNFITDSEVTRVISPMDILNKSDALIISSGVMKRSYSCKGMGLKNVMYATDYLKKVTKNILDTGKSNILENKTVLVLGCGKTTDEVVSYAIRENVKMIAAIDRKNMPPRNRTTSWPLPDDSYKLSYAYDEARFKMMMDPRSFNMTLREIDGDKEVEQARICQVKYVDGKPVMQDRDQIFPIDMVIISIGNIGYEEDLINYFDIDIVNKLVDSNNHKNSNKVFICGDALLNNGKTALAIEDGIKCAKEVIEYLEA